MSIKSEMERISNNVSDALAATAEMGASVPEGANSDNLGTLIRSIPTGGGGGGLPPLRIYAKKSETAYRQEIIEGGATKTYTAAEIHELVSQRVVILETYTSRDTKIGLGYHQQYAGTTFSYDGTVSRVHFRGVYANDLYKLVPSYVSIDEFGMIYVSEEEWSGGSVETDQFLTKLGFPADAKKVGDRLAELSAQINNSGSSGASINVTAEVGQTIVVKEVDANGKPTAWEAAEYQKKICGETIEFILEETNVVFEYNEEMGVSLAIIPCTKHIKEDVVYTVAFNGVNYQNSIDEFGNLGNAIINGGEDTGEPYAIVPVTADGYLIVVPLVELTEAVLSIQCTVKTPIDKGYLPTNLVYGVPNIAALSLVDLITLHSSLCGGSPEPTDGWVETLITDEEFNVLIENAPYILPYLDSTVGVTSYSENEVSFKVDSYYLKQESGYTLYMHQHRYRRNVASGVIEKYISTTAASYTFGVT